MEEANREFQRALQLDPLDTFVNYAASFGLLSAGRYDDAIRQLPPPDATFAKPKHAMYAD